ncbi:MAG: mechanosensitive ion channel family protein [Myxococcota bacterium]
MSEIFDVAAWREVLVDSLAELGTTVAGFLPNLAATLVILGVGWLLSRLAQAVAEGLLRRLGLDRATAQLQATDTLREAGIASAPSRIVARLVFWVLMLTFVLSAVETLGLTAVTTTIDRLIGFLPNVIAAALILVLGLLLARFVRNLVSSGAAVADIGQAQRIGALAQGALVVVVAVVALEQLGIETDVVVTILTAAVATLGLTIGVAFALGARPVITHILAGHFLRQTLTSGGSVEVDGRRGVVERVGPVDTLLRDETGAWSIPNAQLIDQVVAR